MKLNPLGKIMIAVFCLSGGKVFGQHPGKIYESVGEIEKYCGQMIRVLGLRSGQKMASVGAGNGWAEVAFGTVVPGVEFFVQDVDTTVLNERELEKLTHHYKEVLGGPLPSRFVPVVGSETQTGLPRGEMDRVWLMGSLHHLSNQEAILEDIFEAMKPGGKLFISEFLRKTKISAEKMKPGACEPRYTRREIVQIVTPEGFQFRKVHLTRGRRTLEFYRP